MNAKGILVYLAIAFGVAWGIWATLWIEGISATEPLFQWLSLPAAFVPALAGWQASSIPPIRSNYVRTFSCLLTSSSTRSITLEN
jgi:hypothetical protein